MTFSTKKYGSQATKPSKRLLSESKVAEELELSLKLKTVTIGYAQYYFEWINRHNNHYFKNFWGGVEDPDPSVPLQN